MVTVKCSVKYCNFCNEKLKERIVIKRVQLLINVAQGKKKKKKKKCLGLLFATGRVLYKSYFFQIGPLCIQGCPSSCDGS